MRKIMGKHKACDCMDVFLVLLSAVFPSTLDCFPSLSETGLPLALSPTAVRPLCPLTRRRRRGSSCMTSCFLLLSASTGPTSSQVSGYP